MIPGSNPAPSQLPDEISRMIEQSVQNFEAKFQGFGMLVVARSSGWITEYRSELLKIAVAARELR